MNKETPEHIYLKSDIDKAFNMGMDTALSIFEQTIGMSHDSQKLILQKIKSQLMEDKTGTALGKGRY